MLGETLPDSFSEQTEFESIPTPFFAVSVFKLAVLSICTMGLYEMYWFYKNWSLIRKRESSNISPFFRTLLSYFYCYSCFLRIKNFDEKSRASKLAVGALAALWIVSMLTWKLPGILSMISLFSFIALIPIQLEINRINLVYSPQHNPNSQFSRWNWCGIVVGGLLVVLAIIGSFFSE